MSCRPRRVREWRRGKIVSASWTIWGLFVSDKRGEYLYYCPSHRMSNDHHFRICESGRIVSLPAISTLRFAGRDPEVDATLEAEYREEQRRVARIPDEKDFGMESDEPGKIPNQQVSYFRQVGKRMIYCHTVPGAASDPGAERWGSGKSIPMDIK
jgi:hypothetical protein